MSDAGPARHRHEARAHVRCHRLVAALGLVGALLASAPAAAEGASVLRFAGGAPADEAALRAALPPAIARAPSDLIGLARSPAGVRPARLEELSRLEALLASARERAAALDEAGALADLAQAAHLGAGLGDVPGAAGYNAELQLQLGVTAAQAGLDDLAAIALRRAASLDPGRRLRTGEAPPAVVELAARLAREVATGPRGELVVQADTPGARVFVDDVEQAATPARLRLPVGPHLLRVQAPGHVPYGAWIDVLQGQRPPIRVALAPEPSLTAAAALLAAADAADYRRVETAFGALRQAGVAISAIDVVEHDARTGRALWVRCDPKGCRGPARISTKDGSAASFPPLTKVSDASLQRARGWMGRRSTARNRVARERAGATGTYLWVAAGAVVAALATGAVLLAPAPERRLRVVVDPRDIRQ